MKLRIITTIALAGLLVSACSSPSAAPSHPAAGVLKKDVRELTLTIARQPSNTGGTMTWEKGESFPVPQGLPVEFAFTGDGAPVRVTISSLGGTKTVFLNKVFSLGPKPQTEVLTFPFTGMISVNCAVEGIGMAQVTLRYSDYHD